MIPIFADKLFIDESQKRMSHYLGKLFEEGELINVIVFAQQELEAHPLNLDLVVLRSCAILVMQASGTVKKSEEIVEQALKHLEITLDFIRGALLDYDDSLNFYIALGYLVLDKIDLADQAIGFITHQFTENQDALDYYNDRREFWRCRRVFPFRHSSVAGSYLS